MYKHGVALKKDRVICPYARLGPILESLASHYRKTTHIGHIMCHMQKYILDMPLTTDVTLIYLYRT